jgi:RHS repeat-associated protein
MRVTNSRVTGLLRSAAYSPLLLAFGQAYAAFPSAPANANATGGPGTQTNVTWQDTSNGAATGFKVERCTGAGCTTFAQIATTAAGVTTFGDLGLAGGTVYLYRVRATNAAGDSDPSNVAGAATPIADVAATNTLQFKYDQFGNLVQTNAAGVITSAQYDLRGRKTSMSDPDMGNWSYKYDPLDELVSQTDAKLQVSTMTYDLLGRLIMRSEPDLISRWFYDAYPDGSSPLQPAAPDVWNSSLLTVLNNNCAKGIGKLCYVSAANGYRRLLTYDSFGRPSETNSLIGNSYVTRTGYDSSGRVTAFTYPDGFVAQSEYNTVGYLMDVRNASTSAAFMVNGVGNALLWTRQSVSISGSLTTVNDQLGDPSTGGTVQKTLTYDALNRLASSSAGGAQSLTYQYDTIGNVAQRSDNVQGVRETFTYDNLNRLTLASGSNQSGPLVTRSIDYDTSGNITYKSDAGLYTYGASACGGGGGPHAVTSVAGTTNACYSYDANGNLASGAGRTVTPTSFNMPLTITQGSDGFTYTYGSEHERVRLDVSRATGTTTTIYLHPGGGNLFYEQETQPDGTVEYRHYVNAAGLVGAFVTTTGKSPQMRYYHRDSVGSINAISNDSGGTQEFLSYEAFGSRRAKDGTASNTVVAMLTDRGFTSQEHLDELGLIHMNGRVYDPLLGRFMSADSIVPFPGDLQSYNRYSYVLNNPLGFNDPTGHFLGHVGHEISHTWQNSALVRGIVAIAVAILIDNPQAAADIFGVDVATATAYTTLAAGFTAGYIYTGTFEGGFDGAFAAGAMGVFAGPGGLADAMGAEEGTLSRAFFHVYAGCLGAATTGDCAHAALSAGVSQYALSNVTIDNVYVGTFASAVVGGTVSRLSGGSFANGAEAGAFAYLFNCGLHKCWEKYLLNGSKAFLGAGGVLGGAALCASIVGCVMGAPSVAFAASTVAEGINGIIGLANDTSLDGVGQNVLVDGIRTGLESTGLSPFQADMLTRGIQVGADLLALRAPVALAELWIIPPSVTTLPGLPILTTAWAVGNKPVAVGNMMIDASGF